MAPFRMLIVFVVIFLIAALCAYGISLLVPYNGPLVSCFLGPAAFLFYAAMDRDMIIPIQDFAGVGKFDQRIVELEESLNGHLNKKLSTAKELTVVEKFFTTVSARTDAFNVSNAARDSLLFMCFVQLFAFLFAVAVAWFAQQTSNGTESATSSFVGSAVSLGGFLLFFLWHTSRLLFVRRKLDR